WGNEELETYTASTANSYVNGNGALIIAARRTHKGYTSARLHTQATFTYGLIQASIKLPVGQGLWPAFWMIGSDFPKVGWPRSGEVDMLEAIGSALTKVHTTVIGPASDDSRYNQSSIYTAPEPLTAAFHRYSML